MKIFLIAVVVVSACSGYASPAGYQSDAAEAAGKQVQATQNLSQEDIKSHSAQVDNQAPQSVGRGVRQEYRRFGKDALTVNSQRDASSFNQDISSNQKRSDNRNKNIETQGASLNKNQHSILPVTASNEDTQRSSFFQQDIRSEAPNNVAHIRAFSNEAIPRPDSEKAQSHESVDRLHRQEIGQGGTPFQEKQPSEFQVGLYANQNALGIRSTLVPQEIPQTQQAGFQNQNYLRANPSSAENQQAGFQNQNYLRANPSSAENQQPQIPKVTLFSNDVSNQNELFLNRIPDITRQSQTRSPIELREQTRRFRQSQPSSIPGSDSEQINHFDQVQNNFESRRTSSNSLRQPHQKEAGVQNRFDSISAHFKRNHQNGNQDTRHLTSNEDARISAGIHGNHQTSNADARISTGNYFTDNSLNHGHRVLTSKQYTESGFQGIPQGFYRNFGSGRPVLPVPQFRQTHAAAVLVSGGDSVPAVMHHGTGSFAPPYAVAVARDSSIVSNNRASISQHLKTPYTQYTYSHAL